MARVEISSETVQLASRVSKALHMQVKLAAIEAGQTLAEWLTEAFEAHLARSKQKQAGSAPKRGAERAGNAA